MRLAITGSRGRLGGAIVRHAEQGSGWDVVGWTRADVDLDQPSMVDAALERDRPDIVVHCAAWTDVDGCAREPELALQRNGEATGAIARACARRGIGLVAISTNEVFGGRQSDRRPYEAGDPPSPANAYGRSKLHGEALAWEAYAAVGSAALWIVRTAWLFGSPGVDFPMKIVSAARAALDGPQPLKLVADEIGNPTAASDLAAALLDLADHVETRGLHHVVNTGHASRADWARRILASAGLDVPTEDVSIDSWPRDSTPPRWGVLEPTPLPTMGRLRPWQEAVDEDAAARFRPASVGRAS